MQATGIGYKQSAGIPRRTVIVVGRKVMTGRNLGESRSRRRSIPLLMIRPVVPVGAGASSLRFGQQRGGSTINKADAMPARSFRRRCLKGPFIVHCNMALAKCLTGHRSRVDQLAR
jgi:hypothetical protein